MLSHGEPPLHPSTKRAATHPHPAYTSQASQQRTNSPPRTPPSQTQQGRNNARFRAGQQRALTVQPSLRETFLDDVTPTEHVRGRNEYPENSEERDPHDLSFSPRHVTRASVFDNMLLSLDSLDQFAGSEPAAVNDSRNYSAPYDADPYSSFQPRYGQIRPNRLRGHTLSSSLSSYADTLDEPLPRQSNQSSRGRGSNFQPGLGKIEDLNPEEFVSTRGKVYEAQRALPPSEKPRSRGSRRNTKSSKSSGSSSVDFGQMMANSRHGTGSDQRSESFDSYPYAHRKAQSLESNNGLASQLSPSLNHHSRIDSIDVAPTPSVPSGPRRPASPALAAFPPHPTHAPPQTPNVIRKNSAKSSKSLYNKKGRPDTLGTASIKGSRNNDFAIIRDVADLPIMPAYIQAVLPSPVAPSPAISLHKPSLPSSTLTEGTPQNKEPRPGFFRRVFGSSRNITPSHGDFASPLSPSDQATPHESEHILTLEEHHAASTYGKLQKPAPKEMPPTVTPSQSKEHVPTLNKKPSSFFRRRKKSASGNIPPPLLPVQHTLRIMSAKELEPSPVSSLRKVMDPYLSSTRASPLQSPRFFDTKENFESDHTGDEEEDYEESRKYQSSGNLSENTSRQTTQALAPRRLDVPSPKTDKLEATINSTSNLSLSVPDRRPHTSRDVDDSFLADSSGNEGPNSRPSLRSGVQKSKVNETVRRPKTGPTKSRKMSYDESMSLNEKNVNLPPRSNTDDIPKATGGFSRRLPREDSRLNTLGVNDSSGSSLQVDQQKENVKPSSPTRDLSLTPSSRTGKGWLEPTSSDERLNGSPNMSLPLEGARVSPRASASDLSNYQSALSTPMLSTPVIPCEEPEEIANPTAPVITVEQDEPTLSDREQAMRIFDGQDDYVSPANAASWLGEVEPERERVRKAYMELFNWCGLNILAGLRDLCAKIALKGETQQLDRILDSFSTRWCECNPNHGFKATDVVHTICYSIILLNTDLHLADMEQRMTRTQFVRNTAPTIRRVVESAAPDAFEPLRVGTNSSKIQTPLEEPPSPILKSPTFPSDGFFDRPSIDVDRATKPVARPTDRLAREESFGNELGLLINTNDSGPLVNMPFTGPKRAWESQIETVLKNFYASIQKERLPLFGATADPEPSQSASNLLGMTGNVILRRSPSSLSKAASETLNVRGRVLENRIGTGRWTSKTRSRPRVGGASTIGSSRTSFDDQSSIWSPAGSSTWSKYSLGKTLTSMSVDSFGSDFPRGDYQQSIGFANALSQAIMREETANIPGYDEPMRQTPLLEDESLELAGAPWAKEGMLKHKHHLDGVDKKAKDRNWNECFAVIEKGWMRLFSFNVSAKSLRLKAKNKVANGVVGGGNWMENAEEVWKFLLRQTIASALPPPGYSKARPNVWALSLPTGAVHLFSVGTPEIVKEFVTTANYWSARLSKEPLVGGISNIEYGWSDNVVNHALVHSATEPVMGGSGSLNHRPSIQSSIRSSIDQQVYTRSKLPGDRANINEWTHPQQSMMASALLEVDQLKALQTYVRNVEEELGRHNELRGAMGLAFSPRHPNSAKAMANWERKSSYLLREIVKFRTYIDCLLAAQIRKDEIYSARVAEAAEREAEADALQEEYERQEKRSFENRERGWEAEAEVEGVKVSS